MWVQDAKSCCFYGPEDFSQPFDRRVAKEELNKIANDKPPSELFALLHPSRYASVACHPDEASNASGRKRLLAYGQLRASEADTGS
jgi:hypothetical protein